MNIRHLLSLPSALLTLFSVAGFADDATTLPTVTVSDKAYEADAASVSNGATRTSTPIEQIPQSVIVVPRKLLDDQGVQTMTEALRNVSNVRPPDERDFYNTQSRIRGFSAATLLDGVALPSMFANLESTVNVERIDVLKGPAATLNSGGQGAGGNGFVGGSIAVTTKTPGPVARREVGLRLGSHDEHGGYVDFNQPINETVSFRLVAEANKKDSETERVFFDRTSIFPSLSIKPNSDSELLVKLRHSEQSTLDYSGLPPEGTILPAAFSVPRNRDVYASGQPDSKNIVDGLNLQWSQKLSEAWKWGLTVGLTNAHLDQNGVFTDDFFAPNPGPNYFLFGLNLTQKVKSTTVSPTLEGKLNWSGVEHRVLFGVDADSTSDAGYMNDFAGFAGFGGLLGVIDISSPVPPTWLPVPSAWATAQDNKYASTALFAQDQITIGGNLHVLVGARHARIKIDNDWVAAGVNNHTANSKTTPRLGAVYEFSPQVSAFTGYAEGFTVPTNGIFTTPPKPEGSKQVELGLRLKNLFGLTATIALFDLKRINAPTTDPLNPFQLIQTGEQRSRGIDIDAVWQATPALTLLGNYTSQDPKVTKSTVGQVGNQLFNTPKRAARLATRYEIQQGPLNGLGIGLGVSYHADLPGNSTNTFFTPSAAVADAQLSYPVGKARLGLVVNNLTDKKYYQPSAYFGGGHVIPTLPRTVLATANFSF